MSWRMVEGAEEGDGLTEAEGEREEEKEEDGLMEVLGLTEEDEDALGDTEE